MSAGVRVSVVLAAFNAQSMVKETIESVLEQDGPAFELIVVDDGSTDATHARIAEAVAGASNVTVLTNHSNRGLTASLIAGCSCAVGDYIARIDAGDRYLPGRICSQFKVLESNPAVGLLSCGTRYLSEDGDLLYELCQQPEELVIGLSSLNVNSVRGPSHHGSTMFRRDTYESVGGYRKEFRVAQDLDLWLRISEVSDVRATPEIFYESTIFSNSISVTKRKLQIESAALMLEGAACRRQGKPEPDYALRMQEIQREYAKNAKKSSAGAHEYFIGACLSKAKPDLARAYFRKALLKSPANIKFALRYIKALMG